MASERTTITAPVSPQEIGERLRHRRDEMKLSRGDLGRLVDVSHAQIQRYEIGKNTMDVSMVQRIAIALEINVYYFFQTEKERTALALRGAIRLLKHYAKLTNGAHSPLLFEYAEPTM